MHRDHEQRGKDAGRHQSPKADPAKHMGNEDRALARSWHRVNSVAAPGAPVAA